MNGFIQLSDDSFAFIDGAKSNHECNGDGAIIILQDGQRLPDTPENVAKYYDQISGGSVVCSICGLAAIDNAFWL